MLKKTKIGYFNEFKYESFLLIAYFGIVILISAALLFFLNIYDLIMFIFLILISNFVIILANRRELLKLLLPWSNVLLSVIGAITELGVSDSSSNENLDNSPTVTGDASGSAEVKPFTDQIIYEYDHTTNTIVMTRSGKRISVDPIELPASSELISSKDWVREPLETIEEVSEEDYDGESEGNFESESGSSEGSNLDSPQRPPAPDSATSPASGDSSSDIVIEGPFYSSDEEQTHKKA
jgi:hypothetical protein